MSLTSIVFKEVDHLPPPANDDDPLPPPANYDVMMMMTCHHHLLMIMMTHHCHQLMMMMMTCHHHLLMMMTRHHLRCHAQDGTPELLVGQSASIQNIHWVIKRVWLEVETKHLFDPFLCTLIHSLYNRGLAMHCIAIDIYYWFIFIILDKQFTKMHI